MSEWSRHPHTNHSTDNVAALSTTIQTKFGKNLKPSCAEEFMIKIKKKNGTVKHFLADVRAAQACRRVKRHKRKLRLWIKESAYGIRRQSNGIRRVHMS